MKNVLWGAALAIVLAPAAANATTFPVGSPNFFITNGTAHSPSITATFFNSFSGPTPFDDMYTFTIPQNGVGSGNISTSFSSALNTLLISDLIINGVHFTVPSNGTGQSTSVGGIPITNGMLNTIEVIGTVTGSQGGGYSGNMTFTATAVPEAATWGMMVGGFALMGAAMRRRKTAVSFS